MSEKPVKCVVWDLDDTLWDGTLLDDEDVTIRPEAVAVLKVLDERGILHSIASRNEVGPILERLRAFGLDEYFLHPQIAWRPKSDSLRDIAAALSIETDTLAFVDDMPFEREEVSFELPEVLTIDAADVATLPDLQRLSPEPVTGDSRRRRQMVRQEIERVSAEEWFQGPEERFLRGLGMKFRIFEPTADDLDRAEELILRTNQLNSTGEAFTRDELAGLLASDRHTILMTSLEDRFGSHGRTGLCIIEHALGSWTIRLFLMSCRVAARGVGAVLIQHLMLRASQVSVRLFADYVPNGRNRMMYATWKFAGFREAGEEDGRVTLEADYDHLQPRPDWVDIRIS